MDSTAAATSSPNPSFSPSGSDGSEEREKTVVAAQPLYERLMEAHVATPVDLLPPHRRADRGKVAPARPCNRDCGRFPCRRASSCFPTSSRSHALPAVREEASPKDTESF